MSNKPALPFADYFEMLRGLTGMKAGTEALMPALDPVEIDKKIKELETVLMWVRAQQSALELSIKTLEFQRNMLLELGAGKTTDGAKTAGENIAQLAQQLNPANWAWNSLQTGVPNAKSGIDSTSTQPKSAAKRRTKK